MKICFFARVSDRESFEYNRFYADDIRILREITPDLTLATTWSEIPWNADLYFIWWWTWAFMPLAKARAGRRPSIITGTFDLDNPQEGLGFFRRPRHQQLMMRAALRLADRNLFVSEMEFSSVPATLSTRGPAYAPHVVDANTYRFGPGPRQAFILTLCWQHGDNAERKGVDLALRAHALARLTHPGLRLVVAGEHGNGTAALEQLARQLGTSESVSLIGRVSEQEKLELMRTCAVYLQPSIFEGFGVAAAEAMASGAPVVASRGGALPEVLGEDAIFTERDPVTIAAGIERALAERGSMRWHRASERIRTKFSHEVRSKVIRGLVRELVPDG